MPDKISDLTVDEFKDIFKPDTEFIKGVVSEICQTSFVHVGIDVEKPDEQRADFFYLRRSRKVAEKAGNALRIAIITGGVGGLFTALWAGVKSLLKIKGG